MKNDKITISLTEYRRLIAAQLELDALLSYGVDNWSGYGDHRDFYIEEWPEHFNGEEIDYDAIVEDIIKERGE